MSSLIPHDHDAEVDVGENYQCRSNLYCSRLRLVPQEPLRQGHREDEDHADRNVWGKSEKVRTCT